MVTVARVWALVLGAAAVVLAVLPLLGLLGYESSFVLALLVSLAAAQVAGSAPARERKEGAVARPLAIVFGVWARAAGKALMLLVVPLAILLLNALRVKNCALLEGLGWFGLLPVVSVATGAAAGTVARLACRTRLAGALGGAAIVLASIAWGVFRFYDAPPVFGYDPFAGWFPGTIYDEALAIDRVLAGARALHLAEAAALLLLAAAFVDGSTGRLGLRPRLRPGVQALVACLACAIAWRAARPRLAPTATDIAGALGGERLTPHLRIVYPRTAALVRSLDWFARDAEFRWSQLREAFGEAPDGRITVFLFESAEQKQRYIGAARVQVAKPWRREVYIQWEAPPHPVLAHELAHVFAGRFGDPIFHVARSGLRFNVGLIEGIAVAIGDPRGAPGALSLDEQVKALRDLHIEPSPKLVFGLGFLGEAPARAYTVAGSFVRFLLDEHGIAPLAQVYREAGSERSWERAYGRPFAALWDAWSRRIDAVPLDARRRETASERLRRPSILHKVCARRLAARREDARRLSASGDHAGAIAALASVCADDPDDPEPLLAAMDEAALAGDEARAAELARTVLAHPKSADGHRYRALLHLGDAALRRALDQGAAGGYQAAAALYREAAALALDEDSARQLRARLLAIDSPARAPLARYLVGDGPVRDAAFDLLRAQQVIDAAPGDAIGHYLLGRMLAAREHFAEAIPLLDRALVLQLPPGGFAPAARRLAAVAAFRAGDIDSARVRFRVIAGDASDPGAAREAGEWLARCNYCAAHPAGEVGR